MANTNLGNAKAANVPLKSRCLTTFGTLRVAMDEKSGMNFSEYMALLSGNTDLLDKAKLEKRIASLEGERKSFNKGKRDSEFKLESKTGELRNNTAFIDAMTEDWNRFLSVVQTDKEGNRLNITLIPQHFDLTLFISS